MGYKKMSHIADAEYTLLWPGIVTARVRLRLFVGTKPIESINSFAVDAIPSNIPKTPL